MSTHNDDDNSISICANCGKDNATNTCNKCNSVKYCNATCKKKHRTKHKKQCARRVAELHDELLFKQPPPEEDCPICFLRMPSLASAQTYMACCGKVICCGCIHAARDKKSASLCPFCRTPTPTSEKEAVEEYMKRMEKNDAIAIRNLGAFYARGRCGLPQNEAKALELWHQAGKLGDAGAYYCIGNTYRYGRGVEVDVKKALYYYELAAIGGNVYARHNLGKVECQEGNLARALKHWMIAVRGGIKESLDTIKLLFMNENIKELFTDGYATKDDYTNALQAYQAYLDEVKSVQRDEAAAFNADWNYY